MTIEQNLKSIADSLASIGASLEILSGKTAAKPAPATEEKAPEKPPAKKPAPKKPPAKKPEPKKEEEAPEEPEAPVSEAPDPCTREDVRDKLTAVTEELGREAVVSLFQRFGVPNLKGLSEDKYADAWLLGDRALKEGAEVITGGSD